MTLLKQVCAKATLSCPGRSASNTEPMRRLVAVVSP